MNARILLASVTTLIMTLFSPSVQSDGCGADGFLTIQRTNMQGATKYPGISDPDSCKAKCHQEEGCKAVDWNFVYTTCWLHFKYDKELKTDQSVTHFYNCDSGPLPLSTSDPLAAGFPATERGQYHYNTRYNGTHAPIVIMQPPLTSAAAFGKGPVESIEYYLKVTKLTGSYALFLALRPRGASAEDGYAVMHIAQGDTYPAIKTYPYEGTLETTYFPYMEPPAGKPQPGDAIGVVQIASTYGYHGIAYDVGTPDVCGVTSIGVVDMRNYDVVPGSVETLDECWMMSISYKLSPED